jgi:hypothetical protein
MEQDILTQQSTQKVYNTNSFTIATILGGPLAAAYMASRNFNSFGEPNKGRYAWMIAIFLLVAAMVTTLLPGFERIPNFIYLVFRQSKYVTIYRKVDNCIRFHVR